MWHTGKRVQANIAIYAQINQLELEYCDKLDAYINKCFHTDGISNFDLEYLGVSKYCLSLHIICIKSNEYQDSNDTLNYNSKSEFEGYPIILPEKFRSGFQETYEEGMAKIKELSALYQQPRKNLTRTNFETSDEYQKVICRLISLNYNDKYYDEELAKIQTRAKQLNLI